MTDADVLRAHMKRSLVTTVAANGIVGLAWAALFSALSFLTDIGENRVDFAVMLVSLAMLRIMPPYLLAAIGYASVQKADRLAVAALVLAPASGLLASLLGTSLSPLLPLAELPLHMLTLITAISCARTIMNSTPTELRDGLEAAQADAA